MRINPRRTRLLGLAILLGLALLVAARALPARSADSPERPAPAPALQNPTPIPPIFGPIITAAPTETLAPGVTPPTPTVTPTPHPTLTPRATGIATPTAEILTPTQEIAPTPLPTLVAAQMGIQINPNLSQQDWDFTLWLAGRLGVKWLKFQFPWDLLEPAQGTFSQTFYAYRVMVQEAKQKEFNVLVSIVNAPDWARSSTEEEGPPINPQDLASFITRMMGEVRVDLYGESYFDAIEVWNEPNLRREWNGAPINGAEYMKLFDAAYNGVRAGEGGYATTVVTAGLAPTGIDDGVTAVDDRDYLRQMYQAGLTNSAYQNIAIGIHPYGAANPPDAHCCATGGRGFDDDPTWFFLDTIEDYHNIMTQAGDTGRQLWATEFGWPTWEGFTTADGQPAPPPTDPPYITWLTQQDQANYLIRAFELGQQLPYMGVMIVWNLNYHSQELIDARDPVAAYALLRGGADPLRPAFLLLEQAPKR